MKKTADISQMFLKSINLYNQNIHYMNKMYNKLINNLGKYKAIIVLLNYREIKPFIKRNFIFLNQKYHIKLQKK